MSTPFDPTAERVLIWGELAGSDGPYMVRLILDTGAEHTIITTSHPCSPPGTTFRTHCDTSDY